MYENAKSGRLFGFTPGDWTLLIGGCLVSGLLTFLIYIVLVFNPLETMASLPIIGGILALVAGVATIIRAFTEPKEAAA